MKNLVTYIPSAFLLIIIISCNKSDDSPQFIATTIEGRVIDQQRNINYVNDSIVLRAVYLCGIAFNSGVCTEFVDGQRADSDGNYEFNFSYNTEKAYKVVRIKEFDYYDENDDYPPIVAGTTNVIDFMGWRPIIFKLNLDVTNNNLPPLTLQSRDDNDLTGIYYFPYDRISEDNTTVTKYLHGRPNTQMSISFNYNDENDFYHERSEIINTAIQDTIELSYQIDCSVF